MLLAKNKAGMSVLHMAVRDTSQAAWDFVRAIPDDALCQLEKEKTSDGRSVLDLAVYFKNKSALDYFGNRNKSLGKNLDLGAAECRLPLAFGISDDSQKDVAKAAKAIVEDSNSLSSQTMKTKKPNAKQMRKSKSLEGRPVGKPLEQKPSEPEHEGQKTGSQPETPEGEAEEEALEHQATE